MLNLALNTTEERIQVLKDANDKLTVKQLEKTPFMEMMREVDREIVRIQQEVESTMEPKGNKQIIIAIREVWNEMSKWIGGKINECNKNEEELEGRMEHIQEANRIKAIVWAKIRNALFQDWTKRYPGITGSK